MQKPHTILGPSCVSRRTQTAGDTLRTLIVIGTVLSVINFFEVGPANTSRAQPPVADSDTSTDANELGDESAVPTSTGVLPELGTLAQPTATQILTEDPVDWIIIDQVRILQVTPLEIRPNTLEKLDTRIAQFARTKPITSDESTLVKWRERFEKVHDIEVSLSADPLGRQFWLHREHIDRIIHHETHAINVADSHRERGELSIARELLEHVRRRDPRWPGLVEAENRLMFADANARWDAGDPEHAMTILEQLLAVDPDYPQLELRLGQITRAVANDALADDDPRRLREILGRLRRSYPRHSFLGQFEDARKDRANTFLRLARETPDPAAASRFVMQAVRYGPELSQTRDAFETIFARFPVLEVGSLVAANRADSPVLRDLASHRFDTLASTRLFEPQSVEGDLVRFRSRFIAGWTPEDLGRSAVIELSSSESAIDAYQLAQRIQEVAANPDRFGDRWAAMIEGVQPLGPHRLRIHLAAGPVRLDALLSRLPIDLPPQFEPVAATVAESAQFRHGVTSAVAFRSTKRDEDRARGEFAEVVEYQYSDPEAFGRAIRRGEIALAIDVPPLLVARLQVQSWFSDNVILNKTTVPASHVLQFRVGSAPSESTALRVALERAIDREALLHSAILHTERDDPLGTEFARVSNAVFPSFSYANASDASIRSYDRRAAVALALLARRALGQAWRTLKLLAPGSAVERDAATKLVESWRALGIPVELIPAEQNLAATKSGDWDIVYRVLTETEPSLAMWELFSSDGMTTLDAIDYLSEPQRQRLIRLEATRDFPTATDLLTDAHRAVLEDALIIPLWEVDRLSIRRRSIRNVPDDSLLDPYHRISEWRVEPIFPTDAE